MLSESWSNAPCRSRIKLTDQNSIHYVWPRQSRRGAPLSAMTGFIHGLCTWPPGAVTTAKEEVFQQNLPKDIKQLREFVNESPRNLLTVVVAKPTWDYRLLAALRALARTCYIIVWHPDATEDAMSRIQAFQVGANMVTNNMEHLHEALQRITSIQGTGDLVCPWCGLAGLSHLELWHHQPLYHIYQPDKEDVQCPACRKWTSRLTRHINLNHGSSQLVDERTGVFALAVVRRPEDGKFLMVQERYGEGYWLPGGGVDPGESLREGVVREAWEEAGADITVTGILTVESFHRGSWRRIIFLAEPLPPPSVLPLGAAAAVGPAANAAVATTASEYPGAANAAVSSETPAAAVAAAGGGAPASAPPPDPRRYRCKTLPDVESAGACWVSAEELEGLPLRNPSEPLTWIPWVAGGGKVLPLDPEAFPDLAQVFPDVLL